MNEYGLADFCVVLAKIAVRITCWKSLDAVVGAAQRGGLTCYFFAAINAWLMPRTASFMISCINCEYARTS